MMRRGLKRVRIRGKVAWWARGGDVTRMGPFATQMDAAAHILVHDTACKIRKHPYTDCDCELRPIAGAMVWPEPNR